MKEGSSRFSLSVKDLGSVKKGAIIAFGGAIVVFIPTVVDNVDWGIFAPFITAFAAVALNTIRIWIADNTQK